MAQILRPPQIEVFEAPQIEVFEVLFAVCCVVRDVLPRRCSLAHMLRSGSRASRRARSPRAHGCPSRPLAFSSLNPRHAGAGPVANAHTQL